MPLNTENLRIALERSSYESKAALARALGKSKVTVGRWFDGSGEPETMELLKELATKLDTTMGFLAGEESAAETNAEKLLLRAFRGMTPEQQQAAIAMMAANARSAPGD